MTQQYDNTNKGALFGNTRKREGKKDPDLQGKLNIGGTEYWLSAWFFTYEKDGQTKKGINLALGDEVEARGEPAAKKPTLADMEDDIPF